VVALVVACLFGYELYRGREVSSMRDAGISVPALLVRRIVFR